MITKVPFLDLRIPSAEKQRLLSAVEKVFNHGRIVLGPEVALFEQKVAQYCGKKYAVGVNSGSDALMLGMKAYGISAGDEVITTALSWVATANAIAALGASPVFADIGADLNLDPRSVERMITANTKAILAVHYTGLMCDMTELRRIADKYKLILIEDAAQAFGAKYQGKRAGSFGELACFSMNPMKVFAACGESGVVLTDDEQIYQQLLSLRYNGTINREECIQVSLNYRMDTIQAAILLERLATFADLVKQRNQHASFYQQQLANVEKIQLPQCPVEQTHVFYTYTLQCEHRDSLMLQLAEQGIETKIQHKCLLPNQPAFAHYRTDKLTQATALVEQILCIPVHEKLNMSQLDYVVQTIKQCVAKLNK